MAFSLQAIWSQLVRRLSRVRLAKVCCRSRMGDKTITLTREFIRGAREVQIECYIKWPLLLPALLPPATAMRLIGSRRQELGKPSRCVMARSARTTRVSLVIPTSVLA